MEGSLGSESFGMAMPHPDEARIRSQNAARVAHRAAIARLAESVSNTGQSDLARGPRRQVGGTFESLQAVPERQTQSSLMRQDALANLVAAFNFGPTNQTISSSSGLSSFAPWLTGVIGSGFNSATGQNT